MLAANHYEVLGVPREATDAEIKAAYHQSALRLHPDKLHSNDVSGRACSVEDGGAAGAADAAFHALQVAWQVLA